LRLLADDLTGALDSAAAFGVEVPVHLDAAPGASAGEVVAVATPTRDVPAGELGTRLDPVVGWFVDGDLSFKKVDSLLRGNTFAECAYLARAGGFDGVVFAPAFPGQRRVTVAGQQFVIPVDASATAQRDPVGPPIVEAFAALGLDCRTTSVPDASSDGGTGGSAARAPIVWVPDVLDDADLHRVAQRACAPGSALTGRWLWCGSAGLAQAFAAAMGIPAPAPAGGAPAAHGLPGDGAQALRRVLMLGASHHPVVRRQWRHLRQAWPHAVTVREGDDAEFATACSALECDFDVAALELSPCRPLAGHQAARLLQAQLAELVRRIRKPSILLVVGGDTLLGLCRATDVESLVTLPAPRAGWGRARLVGGMWDGLICHSRSGAFGDEFDLDDMLRFAAGGAPPAASAPQFEAGRGTTSC
jgi:uncharacterized protein YgbK (DUF1537 family)